MHFLSFPRTVLATILEWLLPLRDVCPSALLILTAGCFRLRKILPYDFMSTIVIKGHEVCLLNDRLVMIKRSLTSVTSTSHPEADHINNQVLIEAVHKHHNDRDSVIAKRDKIRSDLSDSIKRKLIIITIETQVPSFNETGQRDLGHLSLHGHSNPWSNSSVLEIWEKARPDCPKPRFMVARFKQ